jgi:outer membrane protein TolC
MLNKMWKKPLNKFLLILAPLLASVQIQAQEVMTLQRAIEVGLQNNYAVMISRNDAQIAANNNTLGNAGFLPYIGLNAAQNNTFADTYQKQANDSVKDISDAKNRTLNAGVQLTWTLFDGVSMFVNKNMLNVLETMGETQARIELENTVSQIILGYYGILQQEKLVLVMQDAVALSLDRKNIMEARISLGAGSGQQLLQSTVDLNTDSINLIRAQAAVKQTRAEFNRLLALDPEIPFTLRDSITLDEPLSYDSLLASAGSLNPNLLIARQTLDLSELSLKNEQSARYPWLNLNAAYNYNQLNSETGFLKYNSSFGPSIGLTLTYPIFDGFNVNRAIKNAQIDISSSELQLKETDLGVRTDIFRLWTDYVTNLKVVEIELVNRLVAKENVDIAYEKYQLGTINDIELRETQKKYIDAQYELLLSQFQAKRAEVELLRVSGELGRLMK